jgi:hypothetical protein
MRGEGVRLLTIAVVLMLAFAGASCGGDDEESAGDTDTVTLETTTDETTTDETTDETDTDETVGDSLASEDCQELINASASLSQAFGSAGADNDLDDVSTFFDEFAEEAPEEIRADFQVLAEAYEAYAEALGDVDFQAGETPDAEALAQLQAALASIDQEEVTAASTRISAWANDNC